MTMTAEEAGLQVTADLPPDIGKYAGFDWQAFYNAILHVMQSPRSHTAYYQALYAVRSLPPQMRVTPQELVAAWSRFTQVFPGWRTWQYTDAYNTMFSFMQQQGRLLGDDGRQWWAIEREWQDMEALPVPFRSRASMA